MCLDQSKRMRPVQANDLSKFKIYLMLRKGKGNISYHPPIAIASIDRHNMIYMVAPPKLQNIIYVN